MIVAIKWGNLALFLVLLGIYPKFLCANKKGQFDERMVNLNLPLKVESSEKKSASLKHTFLVDININN